MKVITDSALLQKHVAHLFPNCLKADDRKHSLELHKIKTRDGQDTYTFWCRTCRGTFTFALAPEVSAQLRAVLKAK